ncbi:uncharacterized protein BT62DRAFT_1080973 [Guyanagaster necrorhizus]|uniref:Uncharacterized protein n=1 Tax=Guyanagaster necrorhizus TaxID=856835 RepID=A0A9P8AM04_9AGAR|nr:uncharacterized protein BT62DRAFT_1080973 [Guyanagaster necrorhizus MCA 3950]KAG7440224.1 hypothetical protein BT62DRAFT_1080973 [Guyanagaster necrorhizus MCA 3950]
MAAVASCSSNLLAAPIPGRVVRFDNECILIPECRSKRPIVSMKSYAIPLWKRKSPSPSPQDEKERVTEIIVDSDPPEEKEHVIFKVSVPSFKPRQSRGRLHTAEPLTPCLVDRSTAASQSQPSPSPFPVPHSRTLVRSPSLPIPPAKHIITVPLRACCPNCYPITEKSLREGDNWETKFSTGARRRRSTSLDGITAPFNLADVEEALFRVNVTVDEVDTLKQRRSQEITPEPVPIEVEDDEDQLFPLPLPRRLPGDSPIPSPKTCLDLTSKNDSEESIIGKSISRRNRCEKSSLIPEAAYPSRECSSSSSSSQQTHERPSPSSSPSSSSASSKHRRLMSDTVMFSSSPWMPPRLAAPTLRPTPKRSWSAVFKGVVAMS